MNTAIAHPALQKNIRLYGWYKIFNKRVFLPVTAIYLVDFGHLSVVQVGVVGTVTGVVNLLSQIPTGYFADHYTRRRALMIGAALAMVSSLTFAMFPTFLGALLAGAASGAGAAFASGAGQSLLHDCLERWGDIKDYVRVMGRAQSKGLIGNIVLVGIIPMTYALNPRVPFILGSLSFLVLLAIAWAFVEPERGQKEKDAPNHLKQIITGVRSFIHTDTIVLFVAIGLLYGLYSAPTDYSNLILKDLGTAPQYIGWIFAASSFIGAIGGFMLHHLQKLSFKSFVYMDIAICCLFFVIIGITRNLWVAIIANLLNLGFWRLRSIMFQHYLLVAFKGTSRKTVLISLIGFGEQLFAIILPITIAVTVTHLGYYNGYTVLGLVTLLLLCVTVAIGFASFNRYTARQETP